MTASFATYASQFLNRQQNPASSLTSSQPLFFSFTSDGGSRAGNPHDVDLDDLDDPHLRDSGHMSRQTIKEMDILDSDDEDPFVRDEEERGARSRSHAAHLLGISDPGASKGWLAHASPLRSPSPSPSRSSLDSRPPHPRILNPTLTPPPQPRHAQQQQQHPPPPPRTEATLSLMESLLPRDGVTRPVDVFSLPDPRHIPRSRRKYHDAIWTTVWCTGVSICYFCSLLILFLVPTPRRQLRLILPYTTLLHTVPLLTILIILSAIVSYVHLFLLRVFVKPAIVATSVFIPATLFISAVWAFIGSFMWDGDQEPTWGETWGLRLFALVPLAFALWTGRRLLNLPREIHSASSLLTLTTDLLAANPFLLALSPAVLLAALLASIPFLTLAFRLLLVGYKTHPFNNPTGWEWHVHAWANWGIFGTVCVWLWTWAVARGILRMACAGVVGSWYFADQTQPLPPPSSTHTIHAALFRASQPSLGSVVLSALILTAVRMMGLICLGLRALPAYLPPYMRFVSIGATIAVGYLESTIDSLSTYALVYAGLTGDPFFPSARRSRALTDTVESSSGASYRRRFRTEPPLTMLTFAPLTLTFPFAVATYLFVAHTLGAPDYALGAALLAGGITALVGLFSVGLVKDTADTLYVCYCIDKEANTRHREEVFDAFEYGSRRNKQPQQQSQPADHAVPSPSIPSSQIRRPQPPPPRPSYHQPIEPRRTQRLESPAREETPDPFEQPLEIYSPPRSPSPELSKGQSQSFGQMKRTMPLDHQPPSDDDSEDGEEAQLFPGSDLF